MGSLFQELKRRNVFKVGLAYAVVAFALAQAVDLVLPTFGAPDWVNQTILFLFLLGFPLAIILAWAYELTPGGIKSDAAIQSPQASTNSTDRKLIYAILGLVVIGMGFQLFDRVGRSAESSPAIEADRNNSTANISERVRRTTLNIGSMQSNILGTYSNISLSPDGTRLAFTSVAEGKTQLHIRELNQLQSRVLGAPIESMAPVNLAFSPDSEWLAYSYESTLNKISVANGNTQQIFTGGSVASLSWAEDNTILFSAVDSLRSVPDSGGVSSLIPIASSGNSNLEVISVPKILPGGNGLLLTRVPTQSAVEARTVEVFNFESGDTHVLISNAYNATYSSTGHIAFMRSGDLWAVPFNLDAMQVSGAAVRLIEAIDGENLGGGATYTLSSSGDLIYLPIVGGGNQSQLSNKILSWVDRTGAETPLEIKAQIYFDPTLSPDGNQVAVRINGSQGVAIWTYDLIRGGLSLVTYEDTPVAPLWSPNGNQLIFSTPTGIRSSSVNGIGESEVLLSTPISTDISYIPTAFSPDSMQLLYSDLTTSSVFSTEPVSADILSLSMAPEHTSSSVVATGFVESDAVISPNGLWLAYTSNETGRVEVFVRPYPDTDNDKDMVSTSGGDNPQWATDTGELFYRKSTDDGIETYAVSIAAGSDFVASIPELLFTSNHSYNNFHSQYSVAADGQRFMMLKPDGEAAAGPIAKDGNLVLIDNFSAVLRQRVPANAE